MLKSQELNRIKEALCIYLPYDVYFDYAKVDVDGNVDDLEGDLNLLVAVDTRSSFCLNYGPEYDDCNFAYYGFTDHGCYRFYSMDSIPYLYLKPLESLTDTEREESMGLSIGDRFTYLLSRHIDLFNLIRDGLAINIPDND